MDIYEMTKRLENLQDGLMFDNDLDKVFGELPEAISLLKGVSAFVEELSELENDKVNALIEKHEVKI